MKSLTKSAAIAFLAGSLYALAYPSFIGNGFFPFFFVAIALFLWKLNSSTSLKQDLILVFCYNLGLNVTGYYWIPHTLQEFGQLPLPICYILAVLFSLILQPHWWVYVVWKKFRPQYDWNSQSGLLLSVLIMTALERYVPQQFPSYAGSPWLHLAPYLRMAEVFGISGFSFFTYWICSESVEFIRTKNFRPLSYICFIIFVIGNVISPLEKSPSKDSLKVRVVQANIGNFMKISSEQGDADSMHAIDERYRRLSTLNPDFKPDLIVWPETAYPDTFYGMSTEVSEIFLDVQKKTNAELLIGGYDQDPEKSPFDLYESIFNSSILINNGKVKNSYHKNILIPFGETLPFGPLNKAIVEIVPAVSLFARGKNPPKMETKDQYRFVTPICYEVLETGYMRDLLNQYGGNRFIVNHTNDSWYGNTAEPYQHLFLSKWRTIEFAQPMIRSTNTGVTSVVFADGSESRQLGIGAEDSLDVVVPLGTGHPTIYQDWGNLPLLIIFGLLFTFTFLQEKKKNRP